MSNTSPTPTTVDREGALKLGLEEWNSRVGLKGGYRANWDPAAWSSMIEVEDAVFDGGDLHSEPGPFKRLGAFCILSQYFPFFTLERTDGVPGTDENSLTWGPRITTWCLPYDSSLLVFNGEPLPFVPGFATAHMLVDFVGYLRSLRGSILRNPASARNKDVIIERTILLGLTLEASTYAAISPSELLLKFSKNTASCVQAFDSEQKWDLDLNDPYYL